MKHPIADTKLMDFIQNHHITHLSDDTRTVDADGVLFVMPQANLAARLLSMTTKPRAIISLVDIDENTKHALGVPFFAVNDDDFNAAINALLCQIYGDDVLPRVMAVTGTNGKTSIAQLTAQICHFSGMAAAVMGTAGNGIWGDLTPATHTTPSRLMVQDFCHRVKSSAQVVALEASSHGLDQGRLNATRVHTAVFSNLTHDHLDYHGDMNGYFNAKARLFHKFSPKFAIINADDPWGQKLAPTLVSDGAFMGDGAVWRYGTQDDLDIYWQNVRLHADGARFDLYTPMGHIKVNSPLLGEFNVANMAASIASALSLGVDIAKIEQIIPKLHGARGRMQVVRGAGRCAVVDYAHTPDAVNKALMGLRAHFDGKIWAVLGAGGERDKAKRTLMAQAALMADKVILTSDNPRSENPDDIIADMAVGLDVVDLDGADGQAKGSQAQSARVLKITDRACAIRYAIAHADVRDVVAILGKGHEDYQEINGVRHAFDDAAHARLAWERFGDGDG